MSNSIGSLSLASRVVQSTLGGSNRYAGEERGAKFLYKLEGYLDSVKRGTPDRSSPVPDALAYKTSASSEYLANTDPKALASYSGYVTAGFSYSSKGRFVANLDETFANAKKIRELA